MTSTSWKQIEELLQAALEIQPSEREAWLESHCEGDEALRAEVVSLLAVEAECASFLDQPVVAKAARLLTANDEGPTRIGQQIGPYQILNEIGRGGMGVVYLAQREDQFRQRVAVKLVKRGLDTEDIVRRFRNERQILASLNHPNIAKLFDGGMTADGLPYFVMEYIEGLPLLQYCDDHNVSTNERLRLFRRVCAAVQHAHQNLIIHRDLKPSNILTTSEGEVKLLDFGVAKLLSPGSPEVALTQTQAALRVMTPEYASPEQVRGQHVTTATDVYSLGVVLYELLTGAKPYKLKDTSPGELSRAICDSEPSKPSDAISDFGLRNADSKSRPANSQFAIRNPKFLRGDLDNIILMALRKDPARRYKSVEQFSEDIKRHLEGLPVSARKDTFSYRTSKFVQRHKVGVAAASVIALAIVGGLIVATWQSRVAARERDQARLEKLKAEDTKDFLERILSYSNPILNKDSRATTITDVLDEAGKRLDRGEYSNQPEIRAELEASIAKIYVQLGRYDLAYKHLLEAIAIQTRIYGENHPTVLVAQAYHATLLLVRGELAEAEKISRRILPLMREEQKKGNIKAADLAYALNTFAYLRRTQGDSSEGESLFREALNLSSHLTTDEWRATNGTTRSTLASTLADQGRFDEALQTSRDAVAEDRQRRETGTPNFGFALTVLGGFLTEAGNYAEADANLREAEAIFRKSMSPAALWLGDNLRNQAVSLYGQEKYAAALSNAMETLNIYRETFGTHYDHYPTALIIQGLSLTKTGQPKEGERILREAVKLRTELLPKGHYWIALANSALGECLMIQKRYKEAEPLLRDSYQSLKLSQGVNNPRTLLAQHRLEAFEQTQNHVGERIGAPHGLKNSPRIGDRLALNTPDISGADCLSLSWR